MQTYRLYFRCSVTKQMRCPVNAYQKCKALKMITTSGKFLTAFFTVFIFATAVEKADAVGESLFLDLEKTVELAIKASPDLKKSKESIKAAQSAKKAYKTEFFPTFNSTYGYKRNDEPRYSIIPTVGLVQPRNEFAFTAGVSQPVFTGFSLTNQYKIAALGLESARLNEALVRKEITFSAKLIYFSLLKTKKMAVIARGAVDQIEAHTRVAENFHQVGMTPLNDLLKSKVELANARQALIVSENNMEIAKAQLNLLLRRPLAAPIEIADILDIGVLGLTIEQCMDAAKKNRLEILISEKEIQVREKEIALAKKDFYPSVDVAATYYKFGTDYDVDGGAGISDSSSWDIQARASWDFWQWGKTGHTVAEKNRYLARAKIEKVDIMDKIALEVKEAWLKAREAQNNINAVQSAVDQAKEGFRISEELYKEQMATSTDVLDARTLLSVTMTNYYNSIYDFGIAKAALDRAMGLPPGEKSDQ